jgi:hypothetical protein
MFTNSPSQKKRKPYAQKRLQVVQLKLLGIVVPNVAVAVAINEKTQTVFANRSNPASAGRRKNDDQEKNTIKMVSTK